MRLPVRFRAILVVLIIVVALAVVRLFRGKSKNSLSTEIDESEKEDYKIIKRNAGNKAIEVSDSPKDAVAEMLLVKDNESKRLRDELRRVKDRFKLLLSDRQRRENQTSEMKFEGHVVAEEIPVSVAEGVSGKEIIQNETPRNVTRRLSGGTPSLVFSRVVRNSTRRRVRTHLDTEIPEFKADGVNCHLLFAGDKEETAKAQNHARAKQDPEKFYKMVQNCPMFLAKRKYVMKALNKEEEEFPIAFSIVMYDEVEHFERLLRAIYRPQNHYCVHLDSKAREPVKQAVNAIVSCFPNVFLASRAVDVQWGTFTVIEPELICMEDLLGRSQAWRYFINLTGQEFPLKTNWDLVRILKAFNGSNNMEGTVERRDDRRVTNKPPLPVPVTLTKGSVHVVVNREFVKYILYNKDAQVFKEWVKDTYIPDETFFTSLNHSPQLGVPGAYLGNPETDTDKYMFIARFKNWGDGPFNWPCYGQRVRYICVFGVGDLPLLASRPELFANKFYIDYQSATLDCMEELHYNRTRDEALGLTTFDTTFYSGLSFVSNHI